MILNDLLLCAGLGVPIMAWWGHGRRGGWLFLLINAVILMVTVLLALLYLQAGTLQTQNQAFRVDALSLIFIVLDGVIALSTAWFSRSYFAQEQDQHPFSRAQQRLYYGSFQGFFFTLLLALMTNNLGILWVALEGATLSTTLLVSFLRTHEGLEAAWKYFILCGVGLAMALFGTVLVYYAAVPVLGTGSQALLWSQLKAHANVLNAAVLSVAFVFVLVGYGTKVGLSPLNTWLPDAHAAGPSTVSAVLSALLLNVALYAVLRYKSIVDIAAGPDFASRLLLVFGLATLLIAAFSMFRQRDIKRLFAYSSAEHLGIITFAIGLGTPLALFGGFLHIIGHSLSKSSVFFSVGQAIQAHGGVRDLEKLRGLLHRQPLLAWALLLSGLAILGMPPGVLFLSEFLIIGASLQSAWVSTPFLLLGLGLAFAAIFPRLRDMIFAPASAEAPKILPVIGLVPVFVQLGVVVMLGVYVPSFLQQWISQAGGILHG